MTELTRHAKGKRPQFHKVEGMDEAMSMILVLASEFCVLRDRIDTIEQIAEARGIELASEIETFVPSSETLAVREKRRQAFLDRLYYVTKKRAVEQSSDDTSERYHNVLRELAEG